MKISPVSLALMQAQMLSSVTSTGAGAKRDDSFASVFSLLVSNSATASPLAADPLSLITQNGSLSQIGSMSSITGLSPTGRNMALFDPESAYRMMTLINNKDVTYKAQFSELSQVKSSVLQMEEAGRGLGGIVSSTANDSIKLQLQGFVGQYNSWVGRINPDIQQGGLLADTQAAQASRFELEQNFSNPLFGVKGGVQGLRDLGISIDPATHLATLDTARLSSLLATNKQGVVDTVQEFSANFAKSANLLNADGNFILKQLDNLNRAIHFIADNKASLQAEFGTGNAARPTGLVAQALAEYNRTYGA